MSRLPRADTIRLTLCRDLLIRNKAKSQQPETTIAIRRKHTWILCGFAGVLNSLTISLLLVVFNSTEQLTYTN